MGISDPIPARIDVGDVEEALQWLYSVEREARDYNNRTGERRAKAARVVLERVLEERGDDE